MKLFMNQVPIFEASSGISMGYDERTKRRGNEPRHFILMLHSRGTDWQAEFT